MNSMFVGASAFERIMKGWENKEAKRMDWYLVSSGELSGNYLLYSRIRTIVSPFSQVSYYTDGTIKKKPPK